jgi:hypothetical protein
MRRVVAKEPDPAKAWAEFYLATPGDLFFWDLNRDALVFTDSNGHEWSIGLTLLPKPKKRKKK